MICLQLLIVLLISFSQGQLQSLYASFDPTTDSVVQNQIKTLLQPFNITYLPPTQPAPATPKSLTISFGKTASAPIFFQSPPQNGYIIQRNTTHIASIGDSPQSSVFSFYQLLISLGFRFFHPFDPTIPPSLTPPTPANISESPTNKVRLHHYHTEHPLEMIETLQGMDPFDANALHEFQMYLQWIVAHRMTHVEWVLLCAEHYQDFCWSTKRQQRLQTLVDLAHRFSVKVFVDVAIAMQQQHAMHMVQDSSVTLPEQLQDIKNAVVWLVGTKIDGISTENGVSEFTHASCNVSLTWMNALTQYSPIEVYIKEHISNGQFCDEFKDPLTGGPLNFNFLPYYADKALGVMPHTVQFYTVSDPAPTYGQSNFTFMFDSALYTASTNRKTLFFGETAYWVNYDIDVPLFLPLYGYRALDDLRKTGTALTGAATFSSGFEFGYWLNDIVYASAAWNPYLEVPTTADALRLILSQVLWSEDIVNWVIQTIQTQRLLLIYGGNMNSNDVIKKNGQAYIEGWDTWSELGSLIGVGDTQPAKLTFNGFRFNPFHTPNYETEIRPILQSMTTQFEQLNQKMAKILTQAPPQFHNYAVEIWQTFNITTQRASQVFNLYEYIANSGNEKQQNWLKAEEALKNALQIMSDYKFHLPVDRVASWKPENPTAYDYMYLWTAKTLFYFWRDRQQVLLSSPLDLSPCLYNIINPIDVAFGQGSLEDLMEKLRELAEKNGWPAEFLADCLAAPKTEPKFPSLR